jgi:hypothetical protein
MTNSTPTVYRVHSTIELELDAVYDYFDEAELPDEIAEVEVERRNNTLFVSSIAASDDIPRYTPTAQLKATVFEKRVYEDPPESHGPGGMSTFALEDEEELESELIEFAGFKGKEDEVLVHTALRYPMFEVLCELARRAERGMLSAITAVDGELRAVRIVDGEERPAVVQVTETTSEGETRGVDWRDNRYIKS